MALFYRLTSLVFFRNVSIPSGLWKVLSEASWQTREDVKQT
jgi:hypothetical protein